MLLSIERGRQIEINLDLAESISSYVVQVAGELQLKPVLRYQQSQDWAIEQSEEGEAGIVTRRVQITPCWLPGKEKGQGNQLYFVPQLVWVPQEGTVIKTLRAPQQDIGYLPLSRLTPEAFKECVVAAWAKAKAYGMEQLDYIIPRRYRY